MTLKYGQSVLNSGQHALITLNIYTHVLESKMDSELEKFGFANTRVREGVAASARKTITASSNL